MKRTPLGIAVASAALFIGGCGSGDDGLRGAIEQARDEAQDRAADQAPSGAAGDSGSSDGGSGAATQAIRPPEFVLTGAAEIPDGWVVDVPPCADESITTGPSFFRYARPGGWDLRGSGSSGGGGSMGSRGDRTYSLPTGGGIEIEIQDETYGFDAQVTMSDGQPWDTWDYDIESFGSDGERSHRATYQQLAPVEVDSQDVDLWYLDANQSDLVRQSEYKARIVYAEMPTGGADLAQRRPASTEVTISWRQDNTVFTEDEAREVISSFRFEPCVGEEIRSMLELIFRVEWDE